jgi:hypothetical protein
LNLKDGSSFDEASIGAQCQEDYFYGKDGILEKSFADEENTISKLLRDTGQPLLENISKDDLEKIITFVHYQKYRTAAASDYVNSVADMFFKQLMTTNLPMQIGDQTITEASLRLFKLKMNNPQLQALQMASCFIPLTFDLDIKFLIWDKQPRFIFSDNPVTFYNQYIEHHPHLKQYQGITGLGVKGVQIFLPISPNMCIALYDPSTYCYGIAGSRTCLVSEKDVMSINKLLAIYARECVYYDEECTEKYRNSVISCRKDHDAHSPRLFTGPLRQRSDGLLARRTENWVPSIRIGAWFSFAHVIEQCSFKGYDDKGPPIRSPELMEYTAQRFRRLRDEGTLLPEGAPRPGPA